MNEKNIQDISNNRAGLEEFKSAKVQKMKERYIQDAEERLPQYFSPEKRMISENMSVEEIKVHGLPKEIFWKMVEYNLSGKEGLSVNRLSEIAEYIDFLASEYVVYYERIHRDFTEDERTAQLQELDAVFTRSFNRMTNVYEQSVGKFLERNELKAESTIIHQSISELYLRKIRQYAEFIRLEPNYAKIENTEDAWLLRDSYFMGDVLRLIVSKLYTQCIVMPSELYSEADLIIAAAIYQSANTWLITQKSTSVSEEQLGVDLGLLKMKFLVAAQKEDLSHNFRGKLMGIFNSFYHYKIADIDQRHIEAQENIYNVDNNLYDVLDEKVVVFWMEELSACIENNTIPLVFEEKIPAAFALFKEKVELGSTLERYQSNNEWYQFYTESESVIHAHSNAFTYKLRVSDWNDFLEKIDFDLSLRFELKK